MTPLEVHLAALDDGWGHAWESLTHVLAGVTEEEAAWEAPGYEQEEPEAGWPSEGTILWHVAHLAHCKRYYAAVIRARHEEAAPEACARTSLPNFAQERAALEAAHGEQRAAMGEIGEEGLSQTTCNSMPLGEFLSMTIRHDAWHGGQLAVLRRLYRRHIS